MQLYSYKYSDVTLIILFNNNNPLFVYSYVFHIPTNTQNFQSFWPIDETLTGSITQSLSGSGSNGNEKMTPHSPELTTKYSLVSYVRHTVLELL